MCIQFVHIAFPGSGKSHLTGPGTLVSGRTEPMQDFPCGEAVSQPMKAVAESRQADGTHNPPVTESDESREVILRELELVLGSRFFRKSERSRQFLRYVVQHKLEGRPELLKERTIGTELFQRRPDYATGDDPVVRVQAGEVRRRLEQYYQTTQDGSAVRIELPLGCYSPEFQWSAMAAESELPAAVPSSKPFFSRNENPVRFWIVAAICAGLALGAGIASLSYHRALRQRSISQQFWGPIFATQQPVLICLATQVTYRPSLQLYERYSRTHPGTFRTEVERSNDPLPLPPSDKMSWGDIDFYAYSVGTGDVSAAMTLAAFLGKTDKPLQVKIGTNSSFADLRDSPAVLIGAFNNRWTMELTSGLHFAFVDEGGGKFVIREQVPGGRVWRSGVYGPTGEPVEDFGIVTRLLDSKTGQFVVAVAGLSSTGTEAAGELAATGEYLEKALKNAPPNWQTKNVQIVVKTTSTDSVPGPPQVVASYFW